MDARGPLVVVLALCVLGLAACGSSAPATGPDADVPALQRLGRQTVQGTGYRFRVPGKWRDRKGDVAPTPPAAVRRGDAVRDRIWSAPRTRDGAFLTNLATTYDPLPAQGTTGPQTLDRLTALTRQGLARSGSRLVGGVGRTTLGGVPATRFQVTSPSGDDTIEQHEILAVRAGRLYSLVSSAANGEEDDAREALAGARATWRWDD